MVYQVGRPAMFDGNMFLPETGTPIWKIDRSSTRLAVWLPDPLTVASWILKSLTMRRGADGTSVSRTATSLGDMGCPSATGADAESIRRNLNYSIGPRARSAG